MGTIFNHDKLLAWQHPSSKNGDKSSKDRMWLPKMQGNKKNGHTRNPLTLWNASVQCTIVYTRWPQEYSAGNATATAASKPVKHRTHLEAGVASLIPLLGMLQLEKLANQRCSKAQNHLEAGQASLIPLLGMLQLEKLANQRCSKAQNPPGSRSSKSHTTAGNTAARETSKPAMQ